MDSFQKIRHDVAITFVCGHCKNSKTSKNTFSRVPDSDPAKSDIICNGCYGEIQSKIRTGEYRR